jgi:hypothetical protein
MTIENRLTPEQYLIGLEQLDVEEEQAKLREVERREQVKIHVAAEAQRQQEEAERKAQAEREKYIAECYAVEAERQQNHVTGELANAFWSNWRLYDSEVQQAQALGRLLFLGIEGADTQQRNVLARFVRLPDLSLYAQPLYGEV